MKNLFCILMISLFVYACNNKKNDTPVPNTNTNNELGCYDSSKTLINYPKWTAHDSIYSGYYRVYDLTFTNDSLKTVKRDYQRPSAGAPHELVSSTTNQYKVEFISNGDSIIIYSFDQIHDGPNNPIKDARYGIKVISCDTIKFKSTDMCVMFDRNNFTLVK